MNVGKTKNVKYDLDGLLEFPWIIHLLYVTFLTLESDCIVWKDTNVEQIGFSEAYERIRQTSTSRAESRFLDVKS